MGIEGWKEVLEFAVGNPVLVGYLAYIVGLLIAIVVVKATENGEGQIGRSSKGRPARLIQACGSTNQIRASGGDRIGSREGSHFIPLRNNTRPLR
jgi:hypothetical protein